MTIDSLVRTSRIGKGWSQEELARRANVHVNTIRNYEKEVTKSKGVFLAAIQSALNLDTKEKENAGITID